MIELLVLTVADLALCFAAFGWDMVAAPWFGILHTGLSLAALAILRSQFKDARGWNGLALPLGAAFGPAAILFLLIARPWSAFRFRGKPRPTSPASSHAAQRPDDSAHLIERLLDERILFPRPERVESLAVILSHGDLESRCRTLETVVRSFEPRLSPLIAKALADPDQTVRALAAAASAQISANISERVARIEAEVEAEADLDVDGRYDFGMLLFNHGSYNVLLSQSQRTVLRAKAREHLVTLLRGPKLDAKRSAIVADAVVLLGAEHALHGVPGSSPGPSVVQMVPETV